MGYYGVFRLHFLTPVVALMIFFSSLRFDTGRRLPYPVGAPSPSTGCDAVVLQNPKFSLAGPCSGSCRRP